MSWMLNLLMYRFVRHISFDYDDESFRELMNTVGKVKTIFIVRNNNGKPCGYGQANYSMKYLL